MLNGIRIGLNRFLELLKREDYKSVLKKILSVHKKIFYLNQEIVPAEKDLSSINPKFEVLKENNLDIVEVTLENFEKSQLKYPRRSTYVKALSNLKKQFKSFVLVRDNDVLGYIWYATKLDTKFPYIHHDLKFLNISLGDKEAYLFDMHLISEERGKSIAVTFMSNALYKLKEKGYQKAYGYFLADNIPALWVHRLVGYKELDRLLLHKLLFIRKTKPKR